ncbi:MAG: nickel/cobalt transporter [Beijerinckiaceae bacterium]|nr:nickel/cobalt transporter [Beijerinckiaceae bacterium]
MVLAILALAMVASDPAFAQGFGPPRKMPFGIGGAEGAASPPGNAVVAWILEKQSEFYKTINAAVRDTKTKGTAVFWLAGVSFLYGVFHAAGPGHGKAIIASYMIANERALRRGATIAFLAAAFQGLVAIAIIGVIAILLRGTAQDMTAAAGYVEIASYAAIAAFGLWLIWRKGSALLQAVRPGAVGAHIHGPDCDHVHMPDPALIDRRMTLRETAATVFAAGARPCTGAILVLVFALSQGIFAVGIAAVAAMSLGTAITTTAIAALAVFAKLLALRFASGQSRGGEIMARGLEFAAALFIALLGAGLLLGFLGSQGGA